MALRSSIPKSAGSITTHLKAALNHPAGSGTTDITITGVDNGKPYIVGVRSRNSAGDSA